MFLFYITLYCIFAAFLYAKWKNISFIKSVNKNAEEVNAIPILNTGRFIKPFTIEKTEPFYNSVTYSCDWFSYFFMKISSLFIFRSINPLQNYIDLVTKQIYSKIKKEFPKADYLLNVHEKITFIDGRTINIQVFGNAVYRYPDTLAIFSMNHEKQGYEIQLNKSWIYKSMLKGASAFLITLFSLFTFSQLLSSYYVKHFSQKDEEVLWHSIQNSVHSAEDISYRAHSAKNELQALTNKMIAAAELDSDYNINIIIDDSNDVDMVLFPAGNIVISKGLLSHIDSKNEAVFLLSHALYHYKNGHHIEAVQNKIINIKIIQFLMGESSWLARQFIWKSDFDHNYTHEIKANKYAVDVLNKMFGHIAGYDIYEQKLLDLNNPYFKILSSHPFDTEGLYELQDYIKSKDYKVIGKKEPLNFSFNNSNKQKIDAGELSIDETFLDVFTKYRDDVRGLYEQYQSYLNEFNNIHEFKTTPQYQELQLRLKKLESSIGKISEFRLQMLSKVNQYDSLIMKTIEKNREKTNRRIQKTVWDKEREDVKKYINFYCDRDIKILKTKILIIKFLLKRYGSFIFEMGIVEFQTNKEKSAFIKLNDNIDDLLKASPNINSKKR